MLLSLPASAALTRTSITLPQGRFGAILVQIGGQLRHFLGTKDWSAVINDNPNHSCLKTTQRSIQGMKTFIPSKILTTLLSDAPWWLLECMQWRQRTQPGRPGVVTPIIISSCSNQLPPSIMLIESSISHGWQKRLLSAPGYQRLNERQGVVVMRQNHGRSP